MGLGSVSVATEALLRAWRKSEFDELWLEFVPSGAPEASADDVAGAVVATNASFDISATAEGSWAGGQGPWPIPVGELTWQVVIDRTGHEGDVRRWLAAFAGQLEQLGLSGTIRVVKGGDVHPAFVAATRSPLPQLVAYVAYDVEQPVRSRGEPATWNVSAPTTAAIASLVEQAAFPGCEAFAVGVVQRRTSPAAAAFGLANTLPRNPNTGVLYSRIEPARVVATNFSCNGSVARLVHDEEQTWQNRLEQCVAFMTALPQSTRLAFVQYSNGIWSAWNGLDVGRPPLQGPRPSYFEDDPELAVRFVPDARGAVVLTEAHLERLNDLSDWRVEELGHGRYLVLASDLAAWYAEPDPKPEVLTAARRQFGPLIIKPSDLPARK